MPDWPASDRSRPSRPFCAPPPRRRARLFNLADLAAPFQLSRPTIGEYVTLLERLFLLERLPPWHSNRLSRLVKTPKLHLGDTGVCAALLNLGPEQLAADRSMLGQLLETFVFQELRRQASWQDVPVEFSHLRDRDGVEVDIVMEQGSHAMAGVEVKASATVRRSDFHGLRKLRGVAGDRFRQVSCYTTERPRSPSETACTPFRFPGCGSSG